VAEELDVRVIDIQRVRKIEKRRRKTKVTRLLIMKRIKRREVTRELMK
jgi:hypothetical protein